MPLDLRIARAERLVIATAKATIRAADIDHVLRRQIAEQALSYGKLVDIRGATVELSASDLMMHAGKLKAYGSTDDIGAVAVLVDETTKVNPSVLASLAAAQRRLRFSRISGQRWRGSAGSKWSAAWRHSCCRLGRVGHLAPAPVPWQRPGPLGLPASDIRRFD